MTSTKSTNLFNTSRLENRPYAGSWRQNSRKTTAWSPDALVYINGDTALVGCLECKNKIDFQPFITSCGVETGTDPSSLSATINFTIPKHHGDSIFKDGTFILNAGLEINIYYRGFFDVENLLDSEEIDFGGEKYNLKDLKMKPYYPMFHGVSTAVSYAYSGGFYSGSISCASLLHFWSFQHINANQAIISTPPPGSQHGQNLDGHKYTNMTPHQIIYDLYNDTAGTATTIAHSLEQVSNINAKVGKDYAFTLALKYWEKRFSQGLYGLKMYGASGRQYSNLEQYLIGSKTYGSSTMISSSISIAESLRPNREAHLNIRPQVSAGGGDSRVLRKIFRNGDPDIILQANTGGDGAMDTTQMVPFVINVGSIGQLDIYESTYETKLQIAQTVTEKIGYEFYQDVDGDLVFKPPMYNLNVKSSRVYTIKPEDIIDISFSHKEPEATYCVCKGTAFRNTQGLVDNEELQPRSQYVDYRLVAKFGWRSTDFDSSFFQDPKSAYYAGASKLDEVNKDMDGCSVSIPLRPELKAGYPIYIEHIDCFYYVTSVSHSFSFGSSCTTSLTLTARRKKFIPPGSPDVSFEQDSSKAVDLKNLHKPPKYLKKTDESGNLRVVGFPNVVMALDPKKVDPSYLTFGTESTYLNDPEFIRLLVVEAHKLRLLRLKEDININTENDKFFDGPFVVSIPNSNGEGQKIGELTIDGLKKDLDALKKAYIEVENANNQDKTKTQSKVDKSSSESDKKKAQQDVLKAEQDVRQLQKGQADSYLENKDGIQVQQPNTLLGLGDLIDLVKSARRFNSNLNVEQESSANILTRLANKKSHFSPNTPGYYRYYSCSHPDVEMQGSVIMTPSKDGKKIEWSPPPQLELADKTKISMVTAIEGDHVNFIDDPSKVKTGLKIKTKYGKKAELVPTNRILTISFQESKGAISGNRTSVASSSGTSTFVRNGMSYFYYAKTIRDNLFGNGRKLLKDSRFKVGNSSDQDLAKILFDFDNLEKLPTALRDAIQNGSIFSGDGSSLVGTIDLEGAGIKRIISSAEKEWSKNVRDAPLAWDSQQFAGVKGEKPYKVEIASQHPLNLAWASDGVSKQAISGYCGADYKCNRQIPWCGWFVRYCINQSGVWNGGENSFMAGCTGFFQTWKGTERYVQTKIPQAGDIVITSTGDGDREAGEHITLCVGADPNKKEFYTIEGNGSGRIPVMPKGTESVEGVIKKTRPFDNIVHVYRLLASDLKEPPADTFSEYRTDELTKKLNNATTNIMKFLVVTYPWLNKVKENTYNVNALNNIYDANKTAYTKLLENLKTVLSKVGGFTFNKISVLSPKRKVYVDDGSTIVFPISDEEGYEVFGAFQYGRGLDLASGNAFEKLYKQDPSRLLTVDEMTDYIKELTSNGNGQTTIKKVAERLANTNYQTSETIKNLVPNISSLSKENAVNAIQTGLANRILNQKETDLGLVIENAPKTLADITPNFDKKGQTCECRGYDQEIDLLGISIGSNIDYVSIGEDGLTKQMAQSHYSKVTDWKQKQDKLI